MNDALDKIDLPLPAVLKPEELWTGKQIFNLLLKPNDESKILLNLEAKCKTFGKEVRDKQGTPFSKWETAAGDKFHSSFCPNDGYCVIYNSELISGVVDKAIIGDGNKKSMIYAILRDYGPDAAANCLNKIAKISSRWLGIFI
jgi:DNA-directed RNA polymerase III subunit RPC1